MVKIIGWVLLLTVVISLYVQAQGNVIFNKLNQQRETIGNSAFTAGGV
ncbi:hypothetical protein ACUNIZ_17110 [Serratia sp. IR-2025]